jgi:phospholipid/cholesterol/gamma-HCH transport system substrate-binding protein
VVVSMQVRPDIGPQAASWPADPAVMLAPASLFGDWQAQIISRSAAPELEFTLPARGTDVLPGATLPDITQLTAVGARIAENVETLAQRLELVFTEETAIKMRESVDNFQIISEQLTGFVDQQTQTYRDVSQNVLATTEEIAFTASRVGQIAGNVEAAFAEGGQVQQILGNVQQASLNLERLSTSLQAATTGVPAMVARADSTLADLGGLASSAASLLDTLEPQVEEVGPMIVEARQTLAIVQRAAARMESGDGTLGRLLEDPALFEETQAAISTLRRFLADIQANPERYLSELRFF